MTADELIANITTVAPLTTGDSAYWPDWVNIGVPIISVILFMITVVFGVKYGNKKATHIEVPVIITKNDAIHSNASIGRKSDTSNNSDKKSEAQDKVSMLQKAKEQALKSRTARRLNSIRSRVSSSSQYEYLPLDEADPAGVQLQQDSSDDDTEQCLHDDENIMTVDVLYHLPPHNVIINSEDSGLNEASTKASLSENAVYYTVSQPSSCPNFTI